MSNKADDQPVLTPKEIEETFQKVIGPNLLSYMFKPAEVGEAYLAGVTSDLEVFMELGQIFLGRDTEFQVERLREAIQDMEKGIQNGTN